MQDYIKDSLIIDFFDKKGRPATLRKGETVLDEHSDQKAFLIKSGVVKLFTINPNGDKFIHQILTPGEVFPITFLSLTKQRSMICEAIVKTEVKFVAVEDLVEFINSSKEAAISVIHQMSGQINTYADRVDNLEYRTTGERLAYRLLFMAYRFGQVKGSEIVLDFPVSQQDIAATINASRETVSREFESLTKRGAVGKVNGRIVIKDIETLRRKLSKSFNLEYWGLDGHLEKKIISSSAEATSV